MSRRVVVDRMDIVEADQLWANSPHATGFTRPALLARLSDRVEWWGAWRSQDLVAAWPVCFPYGDNAGRPIFAYYVGPMLGGEAFGFKYHRYWAIQQQALKAMISTFVREYRDVVFSLPPGFTDLRAFQWSEAGGESLFEYKLRHTAQIDALDRSDEELFQQMARNRKRDIVAIESKPPTRTDDWSLDELHVLHYEPMLRQGVPFSPNRAEAFTRIVCAARDDFGRVLAFRDPENGRLASVIVMIYGRDDANNVLCVSDEAWRSLGLTAWTTYQGIQAARADGLRLFDFNGANSPKRAADKHAYGAETTVYFNCSLGSAMDEKG